MHGDLSLLEIREVFEAALAFVKHAETLCRRPFYGRLHKTLVTQAKAFLSSFHHRQLTRLTTALEAERWSRLDQVPLELQTLLDARFLADNDADADTSTEHPDRLPSITASSASSAGSSAIRSSDEEKERETKDGEREKEREDKRTQKYNQLLGDLIPIQDDEAKESAQEKDQEQDKDKSSRRVLTVKQTLPDNTVETLAYPVVPSTVLLLRILHSYVECASHLHLVATDVLNKMVEVLSVFNSRTCQLVLGAGAMHLAGLKSITATHLALASQSVGLITTQIPVVREALSRRLPAQHAVLLQALDNVLNDYENHQKEISSKLVNIVRDLVEATCRRVEWLREDFNASASSSASDAPDPAIKQLLSSTSSLHRALTELMLAKQRDEIFGEIGQVFSQIFLRYLSKLDLNRKNNAKVVAVNISLILRRLRSLAGCGPEVGKPLEQFVPRQLLVA